MKAFLLAAGLGSRLRPLTDRTPKCMLQVGGRPMLDIWIDALGAAGVDEVLINLHHRSEVVLDYLEHRTGGPVTRAVYEPELLGSAGTLVANRDWVDGEELFLACYADSLTDFDLRKLVDAHRAGGTVATLTLFHA
ncbi:MAG TPA: nucleotidyltransferase family protein, partial [Acidimicrobiales bacterium]|nr:nucleotidyltransferase family protein [Acidimicrobiales bacterium]